MIGAYSAGFLVKKGRRRVLIWSAFIGIIGAGITIYQRFWAIMLGRFIYGFSTGFIAIAMPRTMEETIPNKYIGMFAGFYCLSFAISTMIAYFMAYFLPPDDDTAALATSPVTQLIFGLPIPIFIIQLLLQFFYFKRNPPKFLVINKMYEEAERELRHIYIFNEHTITPKEMIEEIKKKSQKTTSTITVQQAFCDRMYRKGTFIAIMVMVSH